MKRQIFILSSLLCICGTQHVVASESIDETTQVEEQLTEETFTEVEPESTESTEYTIDVADEIVETQPCEDELIIPAESTQNLWTDDAIVHNSRSMQAVILKSLNQKTAPEYKIKSDSEIKLNDTAVSLGDQTYYGETVYIINNFLSEESDNVSETDEAAGASVFPVKKSNKVLEKWDNISETSSAYVVTKIKTQRSECPFDTPSECAIWVRKPVISEVVAPHSKTLRPDVMSQISNIVKKNPDISANAPSMAPLLNRYKVLMRASHSCCTGGLTYKMQKSGATQKFIYKFLADDANFAGFGSRCMVLNDEQIDMQLSETDRVDTTFENVTDVRNTCLCKSKDSLKALLAPFEQLYKKYPKFADADFEYRYFDGLGRRAVESVNTDVQNVLDQLEMCP